MGQWRADNELSSPQLISKLEEKKGQKKEGRKARWGARKKKDLYFGVRWLGQHRHKRCVKYCQGSWQQGPGCALRSAVRKMTAMMSPEVEGTFIVINVALKPPVCPPQGNCSVCPGWSSILNKVIPGCGYNCPAGVGTDGNLTLPHWPGRSEVNMGASVPHGHFLTNPFKG